MNYVTNRATRASLGNLAFITICFFFTNSVISHGFDKHQIRDEINQVIDSGELILDDFTLPISKSTKHLYQYFSNNLIWGESKKKQYLLFLAKLDEEGLEPDRYFISQLQQPHTASENNRELLTSAKLDVLLTESLRNLVNDLYFGQISPYRIDPNWKSILENKEDDLTPLLRRILEENSLYQNLTELLPNQDFYQRLKTALARYKKIKSRGGWQEISAGPALKIGIANERVTELKKRLHAEGYIENTTELRGVIFDKNLEHKIKLYQKRNNLKVDGIVGLESLKALNTSVEKRIEQIKINMERARWVFRELIGNFLIVNIASHTAYLVKNSNVIWKSRVIVGRNYRQTPIFKSTLEYIVLNPTWTVPPTILKRDILPEIEKDPYYIKRHDFQILDKDENKIEFENVNFDMLDGNFFPYRLRQRPGPSNPLGNLKFIFPNPFFVYLHDTPNKELFERTDRTFSSGCIRIENPIELASLLLDGHSN